MPSMSSKVHFEILWYRRAKFNVLTVNVCASVKIVVAHPLSEVLHMTFVRLKHSLHHCTLPQQIGQPSHVQRIQKIYLEIEFVANMESVEGYAFHE